MSGPDHLAAAAPAHNAAAASALRALAVGAKSWPLAAPVRAAGGADRSAGEEPQREVWEHLREHEVRDDEEEHEVRPHAGLPEVGLSPRRRPERREYPEAERQHPEREADEAGLGGVGQEDVVDDRVLGGEREV